MRVAIYARVSRAGQSVENPITALTEVGERLAWTFVEVFADQGISKAWIRRTPAGRASFQVFAELERALLSERVRASLQRQKAEGVRLGRPELAEEKRVVVRRELQAGKSIRQAALMAGCSVGSAHKVRATMSVEA